MNDIEYYEELDYLEQCIKEAKSKKEKRMFQDEYNSLLKEAQEIYPDMFSI